jgi:hypothetical protein
MIGMNTPKDADYADREPRSRPSRTDPMADALDAFLLEHRVCGAMVPHFVSLDSGVRAREDDRTFSLMCRGCGASLVLPLS